MIYRHHNAILDVNSIFRYANISNNASLEMVKCKNPRKVTNVTICVQMENGSRVTGEYPTNVNIAKILTDLKVDCNTESAVIIFTQREVRFFYIRCIESILISVTSKSFF